MAEKKRAYYKSHWLLAEALALAQATPPSSTCSSSTSSSCNSSVQSRRRQRENIIMHMLAYDQCTHAKYTLSNTHLPEWGHMWFLLCNCFIYFFDNCFLKENIFHLDKPFSLFEDAVRFSSLLGIVLSPNAHIHSLIYLFEYKRLR